MKCYIIMLIIHQLYPIYICKLIHKRINKIRTSKSFIILERDLKLLFKTFGWGIAEEYLSSKISFKQDHFQFVIFNLSFLIDDIHKMPGWDIEHWGLHFQDNGCKTLQTNNSNQSQCFKTGCPMKMLRPDITDTVSLIDSSLIHSRTEHIQRQHKNAEEPARIHVL